MNVTSPAVDTRRALAALESAPTSRASGFSQILQSLNTDKISAVINPASATLISLPLQRGDAFIQNMTREQRRSIVLDPDFLAAPAALERL